MTLRVHDDRRRSDSSLITHYSSLPPDGAIAAIASKGPPTARERCLRSHPSAPGAIHFYRRITFLGGRHTDMSICYRYASKSDRVAPSRRTRKTTGGV